MEHIRTTPEGFTHWVGFPGHVLTFDPSCPACWEQRCTELEERLEEADRYITDANDILRRIRNDWLSSQSSMALERAWPAMRELIDFVDHGATPRTWLAWKVHCERGAALAGKESET